MKYQLIRLLYPYRCSKYALLYIRKFLLKEKQLHSIEMDWRYKQAPPLLVCTPQMIRMRSLSNNNVRHIIIQGHLIYNRYTCQQQFKLLCTFMPFPFFANPASPPHHRARNADIANKMMKNDRQNDLWHGCCNLSSQIKKSLTHH